MKEVFAYFEEWSKMFDVILRMMIKDTKGTKFSKMLLGHLSKYNPEWNVRC